MIRATAKVNIEEFRKTVMQKFGEQVLPDVVDFAVKHEQSLLSDCLVDSFKRTTVYRGLNGDFEGDENNDIPAILGLTSSECSEFISFLNNLIENTITSESIRGRGNRGRFTTIGNGISLSFSLSFAKMIEAIRDYSANTYVSQNGHTINWLDWLLDGSGYIPNYIVSFDLENFADSRSGRAMMIRVGTRDWDIHDYNWFPSNKNFIVQAVEDEQWKECFKKRLTEAINSVTARYKFSVQ